MKLLIKSAGISLLGVLFACSNSPMQQESFSQQVAINQISDLLVEQCRAQGISPGTEGFNACYWNLAAEVRESLRNKQEAALLDAGLLSATDWQAQAFRNQDNADRRVAAENSWEPRAEPGASSR